MSTRLPELSICRNHREREAEARCALCEMPFCGDCLVELRGRIVCGRCKPAALREARRRVGRRDRPAEEALVLALIGIVPCLVPFVAPLALLKGMAALRPYRQDPALPNRWKAVTAIAISGAALVLWGAGLARWLGEIWK